VRAIAVGLAGFVAKIRAQRLIDGSADGQPDHRPDDQVAHAAGAAADLNPPHSRSFDGNRAFAGFERNGIAGYQLEGALVLPAPGLEDLDAVGEFEAAHRLPGLRAQWQRAEKQSERQTTSSDWSPHLDPQFIAGQALREGYPYWGTLVPRPRVA